MQETLAEYRAAKQAQQEQPVEEKGFFSRAFDDVKSTVGNWATGAVQGYQEVVRQGNTLAESDPLALSGTPMQEGITNAPAPEQTPEQQQQVEQYQQAVGTLAEETVKPVVLPAALVSNTAGVAAIPFMAQDAQHSYEEGGGGLSGVGNVARDFTYGGAVDWYNQPDLRQQFYDRPVSTAASGAMSIVPPILIGKGAIERITRIREAKQTGVREDGSPIIEEVQPINAEGKTMQETLAEIRQTREQQATILPDVPGETVSSAIAENVSKDINAPTAPIEAAPPVRGNDIIAAGEQQLGKPYELGADGVNATDCGKFTQDTLAENGITLDYRTADGQYLQMEQAGKVFTSETDAQVGDLVFFDVASNRGTWSASNDPAAVNSSGEAYKGITHVGIYAGEGKVLQAGSKGVSYADINAFGDIVGFAKTGEKGRGTRQPYEMTQEEFTSQEGYHSRYANEDYIDTAETRGGTWFLEGKDDGGYKTDAGSVLGGPIEAGRIGKLENPFRETYKDINEINFVEEFVKEKYPEKYEIINDDANYKGWAQHTANVDKLFSEWLKDNGYDGAILHQVNDPAGKNAVFALSADKFGQTRKGSIESALKEGKSVPENVLKEYPDLKEKYQNGIELNSGEQASLGGYSTIPAETTYNKPVTRSEIIKDVNELIPARAGRTGSYEGLYKGDPGVIRSKNYGDVETLSHEIGHYADSKLKITGHDAELINAANAQWGSNREYAKYTPEQRRAEGIAEFGRQYMINKEEALKNFPEYGKDFTSKLATDSKLSGQIESISEKMRAWHAQTPEARGRGGVSFGYENENTIKERAKDIGTRIYEVMVDDKIGLTRFVNDFETATGKVLKTNENPEKLARLANNSAQVKSDIMVSESNPEMAIKALNTHYDGALVHDVTINSILTRLTKEVTSKEYPEYLSKGNFKNWNEAFDTYLVARRQLEIQSTKEKYTGPMSKSDAQSIIDKAPKQFDELAQDFYNYNDNLMRVRVAEGLTSATEYAELKSKNQNYAHMARDFEDTAAQINGRGKGKGFGNIADPMKRLSEEGSARSVISPIESAIIDTYATFNMVERNRVAQAFVKLSDVNGAGRFVEKVPGNADAKNSIFTVMTEGKKQAYQTEPEYYRAIMSITENATNPIVKLFSYPAKWLRAGAILSPEFFVKNPIKDTVEAYIYSKNGFVPVVDTVKGVFAMFKNEELYNEYKSSGAIMSSFLNSDRASLSTKVNDTVKGKSFESPIESAKTLVKTAKKEPIKLPAETLRSVVSGLQWLTDISETGTRLGEYMKSKGNGKSITDSALAAQEVTLNFSRSGSIGKEINKMVPFFNAAIQGTDKMVREFYKDPKGVSSKIATAITLPTIIITLLGINDQEIQELPDYERDNFWILRAGDKLVRIPKPLGLNIFANITEQSIKYMYDKNPKSIKEFIKDSASGFVPNLIPTAALTLAEWTSNYSFFREANVVPQALQNAKPEKQYNAYTSETAKLAGDITGQSPMKIDNAINNLGGGLAGFAVLGADKLIKTISGDNNELPAKKLTERPVIKALFSKNSKSLSQSTEQFYDRLKELEQDHDENGKKGVIPRELQKYRKANTALQENYRKKKEILANSNMDAETKRFRIDELQEKHNQLILKALGK